MKLGVEKNPSAPRYVEHEVADDLLSTIISYEVTGMNVFEEGKTKDTYIYGVIQGSESFVDVAHATR